MNWVCQRLASRLEFLALALTSSVAAGGDENILAPPVIPDSFPVTVIEGVTDPKEYRGTFYTNVDPLERESTKGKRVYLTPSVGFEKALNRTPLELPGMDGEALAIAVSRARLDVKDAVFETEEGGWAKVRAVEGLQLVVTPDRTELYLSVMVSELRRAERGVAAMSLRSMRIPFIDIADRVFQAADHFISEHPWEDDRYYLVTNDEKLIPVKMVGHTNNKVWVVLSSQFSDPNATEINILRVESHLLRRLPQDEIKRLRSENIGRFPVDWFRVFFAGQEPLRVEKLSGENSLQARYESLWQKVHEMPGVISLPFPTVNCAVTVAAS